MANQLTMDKSLAINNLRAAGYSERRIADSLGAVRRHLQPAKPNSTKASTGSDNQAATGSPNSNSTKAPTGSEEPATSAAPETAPRSSGSQCEPFRELIV
ncbi:hypothetical protein [Roseimaritima sediminicola]|uniref:hypothetical protein n=1 Tax=Roseimaritima sediminicola TaxID=2662066 RepID=UPI0012983541|nr:hypothetical protein [Roseimaritima sediminicola]